MPRKHPLFPQHHETSKDPSLAYSDHLPILASVPLGDGIEPLNIISLNILGKSCSGVHDKTFNDTDQTCMERYDRIAAGLAAGAITQNASVILLQEASPLMVPSLEKVLSTEIWDIIVGDESGIISVYRKDHLHLQKTKLDKVSRICSMSFQNPSSGKTIDIHNIWGIFDPFPNGMEQLFRQTLTETASEISVMLGDTNSRIAPLDNRRRNITTGIVPAIFNTLDELPADLQRSDYPDGGFYRDETGAIKQLTTQVLDFSTGQVVVDERSAEESELWPEFRMIMCLDDSYSERKVVDSFTVFEYEEELKAGLQDTSVLVRMAADSFNNKALAVRFPIASPVLASVRVALQDEDGVQFHNFDEGVRYGCVFVPIEKINLLHDVLVPYIPRLYLVNKINKQIERLSESHWYFRDEPEKVVKLTELRDELLAAKEDSTEDLLARIQNWENTPFIESNAHDSSSLITDNKMLMGVHRNIFFSRHRPGVLTSTQTMIQELKDCLLPVISSASLVQRS